MKSGTQGTELVGARLIQNAALTLADIPDPGAPWEAIWEFALSYNGYEEAGSLHACAEIANGEGATLSMIS